MTHDELARLEAESIRRFVQRVADDGLLSGTVLDFGCGQQPYRPIVEAAGGMYHPFDRRHYGGNVSRKDVGEVLPTYEAIICTQVIQYVDAPSFIIETLFNALKSGGHLVLTYPTCWPELRDELWRFTKIGMERLLTEEGFVIQYHDERSAMEFTGFRLALGYGVVARA